MASGLQSASALSADEALRGLWRQAGLPPEALAFARLTGSGADLPSSFAVGVAAQASIAAAALAACEFAHDRGAARQQVTVDSAHAAIECTGWFSLDGRSPDLWDPLSGLYRCADGFVRIHANFAHHREGALRLLGLRPGEAERADVQSALTDWRAHDFEDAAARAGLVATALRSFAEWDATPQGRAIAAQPLFTIERLAGDAPPLPLPPLAEQDRPLAGVRVLDLTRILAGPVGGKALAAYGADVMLVNAPHLPNIDAIADTSRGKLSTHIDLRAVEGQAAMRSLLAGAHVWVQGYRPGGLQALGWGPDEVAAMRPGIVYVSLSAYGTRGPWAGRRGFDSLVQTAMGFNQAEGEAAGGGAPRPLPMQILDEATGYLIALGAAAALRRQQREGGQWHVQVSLAQTGHWLRSLGRLPQGLAAQAPDRAAYLETTDSGFGRLQAVRHSAQLARTPAGWKRESMPPGTHPPRWP
ncbi:CoA transferase [Acidovorax sp. Leaf160]|uniref:CoA transferase n=1 Tax=Acidovorax sp. Leaf160 TaxID=1736280 RepID=UPI0007009825|nr:CoA transferase [Acidovorax sp. Leaf160]KQR57960.1 carnitine dehydratase [Acidovorax sp. Leaf160]